MSESNEERVHDTERVHAQDAAEGAPDPGEPTAHTPHPTDPAEGADPDGPGQH